MLHVVKSCPLNENCLCECILYNALVNITDQSRNYYGTREKHFKARYNNHTATFKNKRHEKSIELSKCICQLKDTDVPFEITSCY